MVLDGHVKDILAIDFSPNGHQIATGSNDDNIRIWDIRTLKAIYTIPAHTSAVSDVKFYRAPAVPDFKFPYTIDVEGKCKEEKQSAAAYLNGSDRSSLRKALPMKMKSRYLLALIKAMSSEAGGRVMSVDVGCGM
ncbi:hypothetical protein KEM48_011362 [Puccinia striiformis f. sp. tritici PST-130]|nr:hypothetical protein KEM48_011362 [Puccinia striiformis f. sp. tritici PST-130]